jgi:hypothetical protein
VTPESNRLEYGLAELTSLLDAIHERYGCDLRGYALGPLRRRMLLALARSGAEAAEFERRILDDSELFLRLLHDLTVHVSELFRDPALYRRLRAHVMPVLRTYPQLKIWHAGCATGEEAYATAILLSEEGLYERSERGGRAPRQGGHLPARAFPRLRRELPRGRGRWRACEFLPYRARTRRGARVAQAERLVLSTQPRV